MARSAVICRTIFLLVCSSVARSAQPLTFQVVSPEQLRNALVVSKNGEDSIFVGSSTSLYRLSSTLSEQAAHTSLTSFNAMLLVLEQANRLLACQRESCLLLDSNSLQNNQTVTPPNPSRLLLSLDEDNEAVLISSSSSGASLFVGKANALNNGDRLASAISRLSLTVSGSPALSADIYLEESSVFRGRSFFASFQKNGFVYFVFSIEPTTNAEREMRIARICSNDTGDNNEFISTYSEIQLVCNNGGSSGTYYSATIHDGQSGAFVLLTRHASSINYICSFDLSAIDSAMDATFTMCLNGIGMLNLNRRGTQTCPTGLTQNQKDARSACNRVGSLSLPIEVTTPITNTPLVAFPNSQPFQSLLVTELSGVTFIYAGSNGQLEQFHLNQSIPSATHIRSQSLNLLKNITELHSSTDRKSVYALTSSTLFRYPVDVCSQYTSCDTCLMSGDPICGWCTLSRSCSRQDNCPTNPWLQGVVSQCPMIRQVDPAVVYINQLSSTSFPLTLSVSNIPSNIPSISYQCVFTYTDSSISTTTMANIVNDTRITCTLPSLEDLPQFAPGQGTQFVSLSLRTTSIDVVTVGGQTFGFTNCSMLNSCFQCLEADRGCRWCSSDRSCKSPMESCGSTPLEGEATSNCSFIEGPGGSDSNYLVHADMNKTLSIRSRNLQLFSSYPLRCVLSNQGTELFSVSAVWNNGSSEVVCQNSAFMFAGLSSSMPTITLTLEVRAMTQEGVLSIENPMNIKAILYSCPFLGQDCGQCLAIEDVYGCGYCRNPTNRCILTSTCTSSFAVLTDLSQVRVCEDPVITDFSPTDGPNNGGTMITINGRNLGAQPSDIGSVWIQNVICDIIRYSPGRQIQCTTREAQAAVFGAPVSVNFTYTKEQANSPMDYNFRIPALDIGDSARPSRGPRSGGTKVTIRGRLLGIGSSRTVQLNGQACKVDNADSISIDATNFTCTTSATTSTALGGMGTVIVNIDNARLDDTGFNYVNDPTISGVSPAIGFRQGGTNVTVTGAQLDVVLEPQILIYFPANGVARRDTTSMTTQPYVAGQCTATTSTMMQCTTPMINMSLAPGQNASLSMGFRMDGVTELLRLPNMSISYYGNPTFQTMQSALELDPGDSTNVTIRGQGFVFTADQVRVTVSDETGSCEIVDINSQLNELTCTLNINANSQEGDHDIIVFLGDFSKTVGVVLIRPPLNSLLIIIPVFAFVVIVGVVLFIVVVATLCHKYKKKDEQSDRLILELERLESSVAHECKQGFAELQTDLDEITGDLAGCRLPYHNFRLYIIRSLFPGQKDHPVLHSLQFPAHKRIQMERGLRDFVGLLHDKTVLLTMIHSLERQKQRFTIRDKSNVGSLLLIALHDRLDYATEILKSLLSDLVRRTVTESHPKLLLRRTESVAEKMLSSWLVFTLHEYVVDHVGQPLYLLYKAVKSQLEKGPIDVITGEARYSLSEQKLIRQQIDVNVINATILTDDGSELSVKLLDCDSISQAKEKILDALYKASQVSLRPALVAVDLEWRSNPKEPGYLLRDDDSSNYAENGWRNINTLKHYRVPDHAMFRLVKRRDAPAPGRVFDYVGNLAVTPGIRSRTLSEADDGTRVWHLFKQVEEDPRSSPYTNHSKKMVTEIYLPRMLSTKTILQKFVDDLFRSMFSTSHPPSSPVSAIPSYPLMSPTQAALRYTPGTDGLPTSIKYLFDFLDDEAANAKIGDVDVVHMWKNNSIPLRFWVNLIKNPEFVFDINKSAVVDSSLSVIAQAIIDGCSTSDTKPTINSPTSKLLYSKEVQGYKASVKTYYSDVQDSPRVSDDYAMQYLRELSAHQAKLFQHAGGFHPECAQYEILRYTVKYKDVIIEGLRSAGLEAKAQIFENVLQNVM